MQSRGMYHPHMSGNMISTSSSVGAVWTVVGLFNSMGGGQVACQHVLPVGALEPLPAQRTHDGPVPLQYTMLSAPDHHPIQIIIITLPRFCHRWAAQLVRTLVSPHPLPTPNPLSMENTHPLRVDTFKRGLLPFYTLAISFFIWQLFEIMMPPPLQFCAHQYDVYMSMSKQYFSYEHIICVKMLSPFHYEIYICTSRTLNILKMNF